ncbi:hypothetical protein T459_16621 [Capsicum annuum]|uniref:Uncharacterized protein n=1 Tax=Capsicum annuum TaxID=4072 RepID=A0A2G2Z9C7_CAPAN|nr:hypothetical protein T459_16621 [Capsicum annuum]
MKVVKAKNDGVDEGENEDGWSDDAPSCKIAQRWFVLTTAYDSGELSGALTEGQPRWKNWAKNFGIETLDLIVWYIGLCLLNKETRERALKVVLSKQFLCSYATLSTFGKFRKPAKLLRPSSSQQPTQNVKKLDTHPKSDLFSSIKQGVGRATSDVKAESKEHKLNGSIEGQLLFGVKAKASSVIPGADQIAEAFKKPLLSVKSRTSSMILHADQIAEISKNRCPVLRQRFLPFLVLIRLLKHLTNRCSVSRQRLLL